MYTQVCTIPCTAFVVSTLRKCQSNPSSLMGSIKENLKIPLQRFKSFILKNCTSYTFEAMGYADIAFGGYTSDIKFTLGYVFMHQLGLLYLEKLLNRQ